MRNSASPRAILRLELFTSDLRAALDFYGRRLGFDQAAERPGGYTPLSRVRSSRVLLADYLAGVDVATMSAPERGFFRSVNVDDLPWRPSTMASRVFVKDIAVTDGWEMQIVRFEPGARFPVHTHQSPEFLFILEGELVQAGRRMGPGWASVAGAGTIDDDVYSETGCVFVLVDRA